MKSPKAEEVIPVLRSLIAAELVKTYGLKKAETARLLSVTPQAVTQYLKGMRALSGKSFTISEQARKMVREYAGKIALKKRAVAETELLDLAYEALTLSGSTPYIKVGGEEAKMSAVRLLRQRLVAEQEAAEIFLSEAIKASDDMVRLLFRQIASDSIRHADIVQAAIAAVEKDMEDGPLPDPECLRQLQQLEEKGHADRFDEVKKLLRSNVVKILLDSIEADENKHDIILEKLLTVNSAVNTKAV